MLVPWNTCGAYMASTLGVATLTYAPFCFFNLINPLVAALYGWTNISIAKLPASAPVGEDVTCGGRKLGSPDGRATERTRRP